MSYVELFEHPKRFDLMRTAFTLELGIAEGREILKKNEESKSKLK